MKRRKATEILFHHRLPTSTLNVRSSCHPFSTKDHYKHNYITVHNGIISNDTELYNAHNEAGVKYVSAMIGRNWNEESTILFNDSEALGHDIARFLEGKQDGLKARGQIAFITVQRDKKGTPIALYFGRNVNPLHMVFTDQELTLSSEGPGQDIQSHTLYRYDYKTGKMSKKPLTMGSYSWDREWDREDSNIGYKWGRKETTTTSQYEDDDWMANRDKIQEIEDRLMAKANYILETATEAGYDELQGCYKALGKMEDRLNELDQEAKVIPDKLWTAIERTEGWAENLESAIANLEAEKVKSDKDNEEYQRRMANHKPKKIKNRKRKAV